MHTSSTINVSFNFQSTEPHLFAFNGQEKDDEVSGAGNTNTATFWEYDTRSGRRWNIDPVLKPNESPYACFSNNPIYFVDLNGNDGVATVDKEKKAITVTTKTYYWKSVEGNNKAADQKKVDLLQSSAEPTWDNKTINVDIPTSGGNETWTINYQTEWIGIDAKDQVTYERIAKGKIENDRTSNYIVFDPNLNASQGGKYDDDLNQITINTGPKYNTNDNYSKYSMHNNFMHEKGQSMGMVHDNMNPYSLINGDTQNGGYNEVGGFMSYSKCKDVEQSELIFQVENLVKIANKVQDNKVSIHIQGKIKTSTIIQKPQK